MNIDLIFTEFEVGHISVEHLASLLTTNSNAIVSAVNDQKQTLLHIACQRGRVDIIQLLIKSGSDVNATDNQGCSPLHDAAGSGQIDCCEALLNNPKINVFIRNTDTVNAIAFLICKKPSDSEKEAYEKIMLKLLGKMIDFQMYSLMTTDRQAKDKMNVFISNLKTRQTILHYAAMRGNDFALKILLNFVRENKLMKIDCLTTTGETPLYLAVTGKRLKCIKLLLKANADPQTTTIDPFFNESLFSPPISENPSASLSPYQYAVDNSLASVVDIFSTYQRSKGLDVLLREQFSLSCPSPTPLLDAPALKSPKKSGDNISWLIRSHRFSQHYSAPSNQNSALEKEFILQCFGQLNNIIDSSGNGSNPYDIKSLVKAVENFLIGCSSIMKAFNQLEKNKKLNEENIYSWAIIFYQRLQSSNEVLSPDRLGRYLELISIYLKQLKQKLQAEMKSNKNKNKSQIANEQLIEFKILSKTFMQYVESHLMDPDNSLIGLQSNRKIGKKWKKVIFELQKSLNEFKISKENSHNKIDIYDKNNLTLLSDFKKVQQISIKDLLTNRNEILELITKLLVENQTEPLQHLGTYYLELMKNLLQQENNLTSLWGDSVLRPGELIFMLYPSKGPQVNMSDRASNYTAAMPFFNAPINLPSSSRSSGRSTGVIDVLQSLPFVIARFSGLVGKNNSIAVFIDANELSIVETDMRVIFPFSRTKRSNLGKSILMNDLLINIIEEHIRLIFHKIHFMANKLLKDGGIDTELLERCITGNIDVEDISSIKSLSAKINTLSSSFINQLIQYAQTLLTESIEIVKKSINLQELFLPTRNDLIKSLVNFPLESISQQAIKHPMIYCESAIEYLQMQTQLVFSGAKKNEMVEWWLGLISCSNAQFLQELGYDFAATGDRYIDTPPPSLAGVRNNLQIIREILNPNKDIHCVNEYKNALKGRIYPKVDKFIVEATSAISDQLHIELSHFAVELAMQKLKDMESSMDPMLVNWITDVLKDIEYLQAIKMMEMNPETGALGKNLNVVPISGLIMSEFYRKENELKTILEQWDTEWLNNKKIKKEQAYKNKTFAPLKRSSDHPFRGTRTGSTISSNSGSSIITSPPSNWKRTRNTSNASMDKRATFGTQRSGKQTDL